ncbi:unnamed protein product [Soboliphyme baturini]|uniref:CARMIL_C domain-containing protein n=1 Tax=Soboliphyme baturini TaxID=241478 RepID=A0A183IU97_9BILA|nr:unnamed protein product [Soboliphyme baturini]
MKPPAPPPPKFAENSHGTSSMTVISECSEASLCRRLEGDGHLNKHGSASSDDDHSSDRNVANVKPTPGNLADESGLSSQETTNGDGHLTQADKPVPRHRKSKSATISIHPPVKSASYQKLNEACSKHEEDLRFSSNETSQHSGGGVKDGLRFGMVPMRPPLPSKAAFERRSSLKHLPSESKTGVAACRSTFIAVKPPSNDDEAVPSRSSRFDSFSSESSNDDSLLEMTGSTDDICNRLSKSAVELKPCEFQFQRKVDVARNPCEGIHAKPSRRNLPSPAAAAAATAAVSRVSSFKPPLPSKPKLHDDDGDITKL